MKRKIKFLSILILCILVFSSIAYATSAENIIDTNTTDDVNIISTDGEIPDLPDEFKYIEDGIPNLDSNELINYYNGGESEDDDVFIIDDSINLEGNINGNVYIIGNSVNITSEDINGNVFIIANYVNIKSYIEMSTYIVANSINVNSSELNDLYFLADSVIIDANTYIYRNAKISSNSLKMDGKISGNLYSFSNSNDINGQINGKLIHTGVLNKGENAFVENIEKIETDVDTKDFETTINEFKVALNRFFTAWKICTAIILIFIIVFLKKDSFSISKINDNNKEAFVTDKNTDEILMDILKGFIYFVLSIIILLVLFISIIGIPLSILFLLIYSITLYIAVPIACIEVAQMFKLKSNGKGRLKVTISLIAIAIFIVISLLKSVQQVRFIGSLLSLIFLLYGLGTIVNGVFFRNRKKEEKIVVTNTEVLDNNTNSENDNNQ